MIRPLRVVSGLASVAILAYGAFNGSDGVWLICLFLATLTLGFFAWSFVPRQVTGTARTIQVLAAVLAVGFLVTSFHLARQQVVTADQINSEPYVLADGRVVQNPRVVDAAMRVVRGKIFDSKGNVVADTQVAPDGYAKRVYTNPLLGYVIGFSSPRMYGNSGLEKQYDSYLTGQQLSVDSLTQLSDKVLGKSPTGDDLHLTIDSELQKVADQALGQRNGAVVVLDPKTGAVLAMVGYPRFDPNALVFNPEAADWDQETARIQQEWEALSKDPNSPLINRATQGLYPPGSTFKTVTLAAGLDSGTASETTVFTDTGSVLIDGHKVVDYAKPNDGKSSYTLTDGYAWSLNVVFAQLGIDLGPDKLLSYSEKFGFGQEIPFDLPVSASQVSSGPDVLKLPAGLADTSYGQGEMLSTPLQMALVAAGVANNGKVAAPYLVDHITDPSGRTVYQANAKTWLTALSPETADRVNKVMVQSVEKGWAKPAQIPGVSVAGKTGTAESGNGDPHAWFIGFAPADNPKVAVAVVVEHGGEGSTVALPIAQKVMAAALKSR